MTMLCVWLNLLLLVLVGYLTQSVSSFSTSCVVTSTKDMGQHTYRGGGPVCYQKPSSSSSSSSSLSSSSTRLYSTKDGETEVEKLLRMARQLREEAEAQEEEIHSTLLTKKQQRDKETDAMIEKLFSSDNNAQKLADHLTEKKWCTDTLIRIVDRLFERECEAKGLEHVVPSIHHDHTQFKRVRKTANEEEVKRISSMMDSLVQACAKLDEAFLKRQSLTGEKYVTHLDREHWNAGECALTLRDHIRGLRREHDEQFLKRQREFFDAQRRKDLPPPNYDETMNP